MEDFVKIVQNVPQGSLQVFFDGQKYGLTKSVFNGGKSVKVFARSLADERDFVSFNMYNVSDTWVLKPCEMPEEKAIAFIREIKLL